MTRPRMSVETGPPTAGLVDIAVPVNRLGLAKTRLHVPAQTREHLVIAFLADTVQAALRCPAVRTVTVVTDDSAAARAARRAGADSFSPQLPHPGLNSDLTAFARSRTDDHPLAVLLADLPALTTTELTAALTECLRHSTAFASDQQETGTTLLYTQQASRIRPEFGKRSAHRHHTTGAHPLTHVGAGLRRDVDTLTDLHVALSLGVGKHTAAEIYAHPSILNPSHSYQDRLLNDERREAPCPT